MEMEMVEEGVRAFELEDMDDWERERIRWVALITCQRA
jgi:hypothetical protein